MAWTSQGDRYFTRCASYGPLKGYLEPMTILTTPGASLATRVNCPGRSSKEARSVKEKRNRKASAFSLQA